MSVTDMTVVFDQNRHLSEASDDIEIHDPNSKGLTFYNSMFIKVSEKSLLVL